MAQFTVQALTSVGRDCTRPECVLTTARGDVHVSDGRGGVRSFWANGAVSARLRQGIVANGIALLPSGAFLVANMGAEGGVWRFDAEGGAQPFLMHVDGRDLGPVNFVTRDAAGRIWVTVASNKTAAGQYSSNDRDGFIIVIDAGGARIVADGLCWANECKLTADGAALFINETFARRVTRFDVAIGGELTGRTIVTTLEDGDFPDGLALDAAGGVWVASVITNRVIRIAPDGARQLVLEDPDPNWRDFEALYRGNKLSRGDLVRARGMRLRNLSSLAFGGPDLKTLYLGSLAGECIETLRTPFAGAPLAHWHW